LGNHGHNRPLLQVPHETLFAETGRAARRLGAVVVTTRRRPGRVSHATVTETGARAAAAIERAGLLAYPGVIDGRRGAGGPVRVVVTVEAGRHRVKVSGSGPQEILVYGPVDRARLSASLDDEFGPGRVTWRDRTLAPEGRGVTEAVDASPNRR
jgi:hypothetical protein